jgi:predicted RNase H-like HicB family nuclease
MYSWRNRRFARVTHRFAVSVDWNDYGWPVGSVPALDDCVAVGIDMEDMLDKLEEEVRTRLVALGEAEDVEIEFVGYDLWTI